MLSGELETMVNLLRDHTDSLIMKSSLAINQIESKRHNAEAAWELKSHYRELTAYAALIKEDIHNIKNLLVPLSDYPLSRIGRLNKKIEKMENELLPAFDNNLAQLNELEQSIYAIQQCDAGAGSGSLHLHK